MAKAPNDTTGRRSAETKRMLQQSGDRIRGLQQGVFAPFVAWRQARAKVHNDTSVAATGQNRFVASESLARTRYIGPNRPKRRDRS